MNLEILAWLSVASFVVGFLFVLSASLVVLAYLSSKRKPMPARRPKTKSSDKSAAVEGVAMPYGDLLRRPEQVDRGWPAARDDGHQLPFWASWPTADRESTVP